MGALGFDPDDYDYGPATAGVRQILRSFAAIDWFSPPRESAAAGAVLFLEHNARARLHQPELFPALLDLHHATGGWDAFATLCARVRGPSSTYDWKFSVLKVLSRAHIRARNWNMIDHAVDASTPPRPGDLIVRIGEQPMWQGLAMGRPLAPAGSSPPFDLELIVPEPYGEVARFYQDFAMTDFFDALQWQLAEASPDVSGNPFVPLIDCYGAGYYPFVVSPSSVTLFSFPRAPLPAARLHRG